VGLICVSDKYVTKTKGTHFHVVVMRCGYWVARLGQVVTMTFGHYSEYKLQSPPSRSKSGFNLNVKSKVIPLQSRTGLEGSRRVEAPRFQDGRYMKKVVRLSACILEGLVRINTKSRVKFYLLNL
jgi:hypothetical protein